MKPLRFHIEKKTKEGLSRAGVISTQHGDIHTPAFVIVGTNATIKTLSPEEVKELGAEIVLANTYHLYLEPGHGLIKKAGGLHKFMNWDWPTMTDSGGFQVFSLGAAYGKSLSKIWRGEETIDARSIHKSPLAKITEEGVSFKSHRDGSTHFLSPEDSIEIQHDIGADIIFAFDECTSPRADYDYQKEAMNRTHRWAKRSIETHKKNKIANNKQALFGIVQGGQFEDLRKKSAKFISDLDFDGFGIGGSYNKHEMYEAVGWITKILPERKPRHLLGVGEPEDLFAAVEQGVDLFDCVAPTRMGRTGTLYTKKGRMNIANRKFRNDMRPIEVGCTCPACKYYSRAYIAHLIRINEIFGLRLASLHNLHFIIDMVKGMREAILEGQLEKYKKNVLLSYYGK